ncbi:FIST C-terminal domain-containing protein [Arenibacter sp. BSSL-BM3]|uniref:FIST C-terminal domain-containing protein n=1 Tax=Arenibacter arenosicollis TaxID=2762274 RepID=A0ABR7QLS8_9FLAO|nr:FIST N-terminal domain-containing protein [Arenibacter arenosicollis]MBC8768138.1 FIST C-terminal domain-containing protein [Arenibacter arenosicollis]
MKIYQHKILHLEDLDHLDIDFVPEVFFLFASPSFVGTEEFVGKLAHKYENAILIGCSTAGEILGNEVLDSTIALTAVRFEKTKIRIEEVDLVSYNLDSFTAGKALSNKLIGTDLRHIFVLSDGLIVNGAELVKGLHTDLDKAVSITGGLAGDCSNFENTFVIAGSKIASKKIVALGLYGSELNIGFGSKGGWDSFGIERLVTKSKNNVLYELDGQPALELYKSFLGDMAKDLPGSGLLFPLSMRDEDNQIPVVRTILAVDEKSGSLTFAGNIPQGSYVRLMKANIDRIIGGAEQSAITTKGSTENQHQLAFLISCVGRRLVMKQLVEEEVEAVNDVFDNDIYTTGFYSYGEIAPFDKFSPCTLHNQTMTITTFSE